MSNSANHNSSVVVAAGPAAFSSNAGDTPAATGPIRHLYVHIPFCARICPYCAFYKDLLDRSQTARFCEAILRDLDKQCAAFAISAKTIYFGGGTPTALTTSQLEFLLGGFHQRLDLSTLEEWTIEANPGSVSARKAALLRKLKVNRISLGVQSWDDRLLTILGREHNASQAEKSFHTLRDAGFRNINIDIMFGLPDQSTEQWKATLEKTITLQPEHISAYCLTYEEDTEFFLRQSRGELKPNPWKPPVTSSTKSQIMRVPVFRQCTIAPAGRAKIISASAQAHSPPSECDAGKILPITARTLIAFFPGNHQLARQKISLTR